MERRRRRRRPPTGSPSDCPLRPTRPFDRSGCRGQPDARNRSTAEAPAANSVDRATSDDLRARLAAQRGSAASRQVTTGPTNESAECISAHRAAAFMTVRGRRRPCGPCRCPRGRQHRSGVVGAGELERGDRGGHRGTNSPIDHRQSRPRIPLFHRGSGNSSEVLLLTSRGVRIGSRPTLRRSRRARPTTGQQVPALPSVRAPAAAIFTGSIGGGRAGACVAVISTGSIGGGRAGALRCGDLDKLDQRWASGCLRCGDLDRLDRRWASGCLGCGDLDRLDQRRVSGGRSADSDRRETAARPRRRRDASEGHNVSTSGDGASARAAARRAGPS